MFTDQIQTDPRLKNVRLMKTFKWYKQTGVFCGFTYSLCLAFHAIKVSCVPGEILR